MKLYKLLFILYTIVSTVFLIYSYGFVDRNLQLSSSALYQMIHEPLEYFVFEKRGWAGGVYMGFLGVFWVLYFLVLRSVESKKISFSQLKKLIVVISAIFLFSFPAFSYDIFNYMLTARVAFTHKENPWIVRPIEIPNEPALAYTRAANKRALYGPTWIAITSIPHVLGLGNVWLTIITFKLLVVAFYYFFLLLLWNVTKNVWNVAFFALNPLVLITVLNEGHNDSVMMVLASLGILALKQVWKTKSPVISSFLLYSASVLVKGGTIPLFLLYFFKKMDITRLWIAAYWLMFIIFMITPFREEMYPWYFLWCLTFVSFLPKSHRFLFGFSLTLCFGLLLRNTPYIVTRQYAGYNQIIRTTVTWIPMVLFFCYYIVNSKFKKNNLKKSES